MDEAPSFFVGSTVGQVSRTFKYVRTAFTVASCCGGMPKREADKFITGISMSWLSWVCVTRM